jgi:Zn-dependent protease
MKFRLLRIPYEAQLWFFVMLIFLNLQRLDGFSGYPLFATVIFIEGMAMVAVSVIVHELGHCWAYRHYEQEPSVVLWGLGGLTYGQFRLEPKKSILVSVAGPATAMLLLGVPGFVLERVLFHGVYFYGDLSAIPVFVVRDLWWFAFLWSLVNLLPILPLDGGHIAEALLELRHGEPRKHTAQFISMVTGIIFGVFALLVLGSASIMLFGFVLALLNGIPWWQERNNRPVYQLLPDENAGAPAQNVVSMESARKKRDKRSPAELVKDAFDALERRDYKGALRITDRLQSKRLNAELDRWTAEVAAFAWIGERNPLKAEEVLAELAKGKPSPPLAAVLAVANKQTDEGMRLMVDTMVNEPEGGAKLVAVDLFAEFGMTHRLARELVDREGGSGFEAAVALESMLHRLHRTQDASTVSDVIMLG